MFSRHRIYPIQEKPNPPNKYAGLRKEAIEYKARLRAIGDERRAAEAKAAAVATAKLRIRKRKSEPNLFTSTFSGLLNEWFTFQWHALKDWTKHIKHEIIPTICCLRAEAKLTYNE
jgi:hypothetical protein